MRELKILIAGRPPTPNDRVDWRAKFRITAVWRVKAWDAAAEALTEAGWAHRWEEIPVGKKIARRVVALEPMLYVARYEMTFVVPTRTERDWDNAVASGKPLTDGLVSAGVIAGDSTKFIEPEGRKVSFKYSPNADGVVIWLQEGVKPGSLGL